MIRTTPFSFLVFLSLVTWLGADVSRAAGIIIDHHDTDLTALTLTAVNKATAELHIAYGHTSHGSQVTEGMTYMNTFINGGGLGMTCPTDTFKWNDGPLTGALDLDDYFVAGDLGSPDYSTWATRTRDYLNSPLYSDVNVVMWSWCGQADTSEANINLYLGLMNQLEIDYPDVSFVYMTGHVNGCSTTGNLFLRNQQIRDYCLANDKILYDFADIESWDPDGNYYGDKLVTDNCDYDSDGNGTRDRNWAIDWQNSHTVGVDWFSCSCAHSQPLNGNRKAYAAWALWAAIATAVDPVPGDANGDNQVDQADAIILARNWGENTATREDGDFSGDHVVGARDASILAAHWGYEPPASTAMPEPSSLVLLATMALAVAGWRVARIQSNPK
ncbi:MAG: hypothetical protein JW888_12405 [Pirellulales bacterium]|nr:hypothetical protein [Pirellulales bacterium]